jgi:hypothetical protein
MDSGLVRREDPAYLSLDIGGSIPYVLLGRPPQEKEDAYQKCR